MNWDIEPPTAKITTTGGLDRAEAIRRATRAKRAEDQARADAAAAAHSAAKTPEQIAEIERLRRDPRLPGGGKCPAPYCVFDAGHPGPHDVILDRHTRKDNS